MWPFAKKFKEPVQSIVNTLRKGEWEFKFSTEHTRDFVYFTHAVHNKQLMIYLKAYRGPKVCNEDWMTLAESKAVASICVDIIQDVEAARLVQQRESFMCLVPNNKEL